MRFMQFKQKFNDFTCFNLQEIRKIDRNFDLRRLNEWQKKGYIKKIRREHYIFSNKKIDELTLFFIANKIYTPSYISLEMALSYYNLIPETVYGITSVTSQKTKTFKTFLSDFVYRHIRSDLFFGYKLVKHQKFTYKIADLEKAILDFFYLNPDFKTENDIAELRINIDEFKNAVDEKRLLLYLERFNCKALAKRINNLIKFINYA